MSNASSMTESKVLLDGLGYVESPRWHDGRLWFAHWGTGEIIAVDLDGNSEVGRCSYLQPSGAESSMWTRRSRLGPGKSSSLEHPRPAPDGRDL